MITISGISERFKKSFRSYKSEWLGNKSGDLKGGISAGIVTIPIALAFGQASGLGAMAGLYGAIILSLIGCVLGGTKTQISSPVGVVLVTVVLIINYQMSISREVLSGTNDSTAIFQNAWPYIFFTFLLAGIIQMLFGVIKLGNFIQYLPYPVVSGFSTGIGLLIIFLQLQHLFDIQFDNHSTFNLGNVMGTKEFVQLEHRLLLASLALITIVVLKKFVPKLPGSLIALLVVSIVPYALGFTPFETVEIPAKGHLSFNGQIFTVWSDTQRTLGCFGLGFSLAIISSINALLTSLAADNLTTERHQSNKELIGQGIGNTMVSLFGGMPGSGAVACTVHNIAHGAKTRLSALIATVILLTALSLGNSVIQLIPIPVLEGILIYIGYMIIDKKAFKHIRFVPVMDTIIMLIVALLTAYGQLLYAVLAGLSLASIYFMKKMADVVELDTHFAKVDKLVNSLMGTFDNAEVFKKKVHIKNIKGPIFFGFASRFAKSIEGCEKTDTLILNMGNVPYIDQSGLYSLEREFLKLKAKGVKICISEINNKSRQLLSSIDIIPGLVPENLIFPSIEEGIISLNEYEKVNTTPITALDKLYVPTAFTPNNDGKNDFWKIKNIDKYPKCRVLVSTLNGNTVFESIGYETPWDGFHDDNLLPVDKYKYVIELNNSEHQKVEGHVSIFR